MTKRTMNENGVAVNNTRLENYGNSIRCVACGATKDLSRLFDVEVWAALINAFTEQHEKCLSQSLSQVIGTV